jgi:hypothetical protein
MILIKQFSVKWAKPIYLRAHTYLIFCIVCKIKVVYIIMKFILKGKEFLSKKL